MITQFLYQHADIEGFKIFVDNLESIKELKHKIHLLFPQSKIIIVNVNDPHNPYCRENMERKGITNFPHFYFKRRTNKMVYVPWEEIGDWPIFKEWSITNVRLNKNPQIIFGQRQ